MASQAEPRVSEAEAVRSRRSSPDWLFVSVLAILGGSYVVLIIAMVLANASFTSPHHIVRALASREIQYAIKLSLISCSISAILSLWVAVPLGYLMARHNFPGKQLIDSILDIPIVLPPLVLGLSLLILFQMRIGSGTLDDFFKSLGIPVTYAIPSVILAQFSVACAFAVRTMRVTFDQISPRSEQVALTLGCSRSQAFWRVVLPEAKRGILTAATLSWARSLGEFGPILVFSGATRMRTEVLSTSVFLELSIGNLEAAVAVSLVMIAAAIAVLLLLRLVGSQTTFWKGLGPS